MPGAREILGFETFCVKEKCDFPAQNHLKLHNFPRLRRATFRWGLRGDPAWRNVGDRLGRRTVGTRLGDSHALWLQTPE